MADTPKERRAEAEPEKRKRGQNDGSARSRDGRWEWRISIGGRQRSFSGATREEARDRAEKAKAQHRQGVRIDAAHQKMRDFLTYWVEEVVRPHREWNTYKSHERNIRLYLVSHIGDIRLDKLTTQDVQAAINAAVRAGYASTTVYQIRGTIVTALNYAYETGLVSRNVAKLTKFPKVQAHEPEPLTVEQARRLLTVMSGHRLEAFFAVALACGLRMGEACGLRWRDVNLATGRVNVVMQMQDEDGEWRHKRLKTPASRRSFVLPAFALAALRRHRAAQNAERLRAGDAWEDWGLVFTTRYGRPLYPVQQRRTLDGFLRKANLPHQRVHDLRHACASLLAAQGVPLIEVRALLGHRSATMTDRVYLHAYAESQERVARAMDALLAGADNADSEAG
jgi:integrase